VFAIVGSFTNTWPIRVHAV